MGLTFVIPSLPPGSPFPTPSLPFQHTAHDAQSGNRDEASHWPDGQASQSRQARASSKPSPSVHVSAYSIYAARVWQTESVGRSCRGRSSQLPVNPLHRTQDPGGLRLVSDVAFWQFPRLGRSLRRLASGLGSARGVQKVPHEVTMHLEILRLGHSTLQHGVDDHDSFNSPTGREWRRAPSARPTIAGSPIRSDPSPGQR